MWKIGMPNLGHTMEQGTLKGPGRSECSSTP